MFNNLPLDSTFFITGSTGGLGTNLISILNKFGYYNIYSPNRTELDLCSKKAVKDYINLINPDYVIHLAAVVYGLGGHINNRLAPALENTLIDNNIFYALSHSNVKKVFYAGTVASYPYPYNSIRLKEDVFFNGLPHRGEFGYALAKRHAYTYLELLYETRGINYSYGIFTNLYGEHDRFNIKNGHVVPSLIAKAFLSANNKSVLNVWGKPESTRDFLHFKDASKAILHTLNEKKNILCNISSGNETSMSELVNSIVAASSCSGFEFNPDAPIGISRRVVDNSILKNLGFVQDISLSEGIVNLYKWYFYNHVNCRS